MGDLAAGKRRRRVSTVEERAALRSGAGHRQQHRQRGSRLAIGFALAAVFSGALGWVVGASALQTQQELMAERVDQERTTRVEGGLESLLRDESRKVIQNMWLTEIMEAQRRR